MLPRGNQRVPVISLEHTHVDRAIERSSGTGGAQTRVVALILRLDGMERDRLDYRPPSGEDWVRGRERLERLPASGVAAVDPVRRSGACSPAATLPH
jgi:hypothetical protein